MNDKQVNTLIYETFFNLREIETALVSMWALSNRYARIPFLRFRFKDTAKDDIIYIKLERIIKDYPGKFKWSLLTRNGFPNYVLIPEAFGKYVLEGKSPNKEAVLASMKEEEYNNIIDTAIEDIPNLAHYIKMSFK